MSILGQTSWCDLHNTINMYDFLTNLFYGYEKILFIDGICIKIETFFEETQASDLKVVLRLDHSETSPTRRGRFSKPYQF